MKNPIAAHKYIFKRQTGFAFLKSNTPHIYHTLNIKFLAPIFNPETISEFETVEKCAIVATF